MRLQQYRLQPSWSIASLHGGEISDTELWRIKAFIPIRNALIQKLQVTLPEVTNDLREFSKGTLGTQTDSSPCRKRNNEQE